MIRFLMDYAIACDSRSIVQNRTIAYNQRPCDIGGGGAQGLGIMQFCILVSLDFPCTIVV